jgi:hypothetical protein
MVETRSLICVSADEDQSAELMSHENEDDPLAELENHQAALRRNIEASEDLIARSEELLGRHRMEQTQRPAGQA